MERHIFATVIDCRGRHWKGIVIYNATLTLKTNVLVNKSVFLNTAERFKQ